MCIVTMTEYKTGRKYEYGYWINIYTQSEILITYHEKFKKRHSP